MNKPGMLTPNSAPTPLQSKDPDPLLCREAALFNQALELTATRRLVRFGLDHWTRQLHLWLALPVAVAQL